MTNETITRPEVVEDEHLDFLDDLRESGIVNMFGARQYLREMFDLNRSDASTVLSYWMETFSERHEVQP